MDFPYYKQETKYTCGACCLRMALEYFGIKKSEKQVVNILGVNKISGTKDENFPRVAEKYKMDYMVRRGNASIEDLKKAQKREFIVIIRYNVPEDKQNHYAVLKRIGQKYIHLWDPFWGPDHKYPLDSFEKFWGKTSKKKGADREIFWFFALKK